MSCPDSSYKTQDEWAMEIGGFRAESAKKIETLKAEIEILKAECNKFKEALKYFYKIFSKQLGRHL